MQRARRVARSASTEAPAIAAAIGAQGNSRSADAAAVQNRQDQKEAFLARDTDSPKRQATSLQPPVSPYQVMAGTVIPAALVTGINSDLPGQVIATVTQAVNDTATERYLLVPQGSRLIGRYDSQVAFGHQRVLLVWMRLMLPDASSIAHWTSCRALIRPGMREWRTAWTRTGTGCCRAQRFRR
jgi:type IV secretion system protein VirB10